MQRLIIFRYSHLVPRIKSTPNSSNIWARLLPKFEVKVAAANTFFGAFYASLKVCLSQIGLVISKTISLNLVQRAFFIETILAGRLGQLARRGSGRVT